ncbi:hypothetical protein C5C07_15435 [Haloferax sp. Atlit-4N]|uniref:phage major capsid protein n=1 Tax=Haloferax sp. Atlit-4N TaxID=2077206 RepID=UPI000E28050A|nr:hypothetical protein [Haloferax sp. Atlit-4N]RDZ53126.1 hypothetical protein C5C07_15435 [Haloferax sp. Atlit-4N]
MAQTAADIIDDADVRAIVEKIRNKKYQSRTAFRDYDATNNDSNSVEFPISDGEFDGDVAEIPPGSEYPRATKDYDKVQVAHTKYGLEVVIPDEDVEDNVIDITMDQEEDLIRAEETRVDGIAYSILSNNTNSAGAIDANSNSNGVIEYEDITLARQLAFNDELDMAELRLLTGGQNMNDLLNMDKFTQASDLGDQVLQQGILPGGNLVGQQAFLGVVGDIPVYLDNTGNYADGEAYLVDPTNFGWESTRRALDVSSYYDESIESTVWQIDERVGFAATQPSANIAIDT